LPRPGKSRRSATEAFRAAGRQGRLGQTPGESRAAAERKPRAWRRRLDPRPAGRQAAPDPWSREASLARLEAVLFLAREPLNTRKLAQFAHLADGTEARTLIRRLNRLYDESGCAFTAEELAGGFQLMSRPKFATWLRRLYQNPVEVRLSGPALETLAVVAYRQPAVRAQIEAIRGVDCGEILRQLMERNLVRTAGRADELGRPYLYATTKRFLQMFGLRSLDDLPRAEALRGGSASPPPPNQAKQPRASESASESLTRTTASENEEGSERDHHRPA
jgi:segregation and condensation protein B